MYTNIDETAKNQKKPKHIVCLLGASIISNAPQSLKIVITIFQYSFGLLPKFVYCIQQ